MEGRGGEPGGRERGRERASRRQRSTGRAAGVFWRISSFLLIVGRNTCPRKSARKKIQVRQPYSLGQRDLPAPAQGGKPAAVQQLARRAVGFRAVPLHRAGP